MRIAGLVAALLITVPTAASADWKHKASGVSLPDEIGDMRRGEERDLSNGQKLDVMVQYGGGNEPVTVYVYRASHPNPALWFERTRTAMLDNVGGFDTSKPPRPITVGGGAQPNGLRQEFPTFGKDWRATSFALVQSGEWLIKARVSSTTLEEAGVAARMDRLLAALTFAAAPSAPLPLVAPEACKTAATLDAKPKIDMSMVTAASLFGVVAYSDARGGGQGLSAKPAGWCRDDSDPALHKMTTVYRRLDGQGWTALLGDAGMSAATMTLSPAEAAGKPGEFAGAGLYFTRTGPTEVVATYDGLPSVIQALGAVAPVMRGVQKPLASISVKGKSR